MALTVNQKGLVGNPTYPCTKAEGCCRLRTIDTEKFQCVFNSKGCRYRVVKEVKDEL